jgi:SAM-dependent methyltransferase
MSDAGQMFSDGKVYERMMGRWSKRVGVQFLDWLGAPKGLHWVEVGCGNGAFTEELIAHTAPRAVSSIDPSEGQLAFARTRPAAKLAEFHLGDAQALPFADKSFDDFCDSSLVPIGPAGQVIAKMSPAELEELKAHLRKLLPIAADGSIAYEAFANAVKGRVPG